MGCIDYSHVNPLLCWAEHGGWKRTRTCRWKARPVGLMVVGSRRPPEREAVPLCLYLYSPISLGLCGLCPLTISEQPFCCFLLCRQDSFAYSWLLCPPPPSLFADGMVCCGAHCVHDYITHSAYPCLTWSKFLGGKNLTDCW